MLIVKSSPLNSKYLAAMTKELYTPKFEQMFEAVWNTELFVVVSENNTRYYYVMESDHDRFLRQATYVWGWIDCWCSMFN